MNADIEDLRVTFGRVSNAENACYVSCSAERERLHLHTADAILCGAELDVALVCDPADINDGKGQETYVDTAEARLRFGASVGALVVSPKKISFRLSIKSATTDPEALTRVAKRSGRLTIKRTDDGRADAQ